MLRRKCACTVLTHKNIEALAERVLDNPLTSTPHRLSFRMKLIYILIGRLIIKIAILGTWKPSGSYYLVRLMEWGATGPYFLGNEDGEIISVNRDIYHTIINNFFLYSVER